MLCTFLYSFPPKYLQVCLFVLIFAATSLQIKATDRQVNENCVFDTSSWKRGLYIVETTIGNKTYTTKLVVR